jgi:hypothetical protein
MTSERQCTMNKKHWIPALVMLCGIAACNPTPSPTVPGPTPVHILEPLMNAVLNLGPHTIKFDSTSQWGIDYFEVSVNGTVLASVAPLLTGSCGGGCGHAFYSEYVWTPPSSGHFTISVAAFGSAQWGTPGTVHVVVGEITIGQSSPLSLQPTSTPGVGVSGNVMVAAKQDSNCREGGGEPYRILVVLKKGEAVEAVALSEDGFFLKVIPPKAKVKCWVAIELLEVLEGDIQLLPREGFPLLPPPEPANTPDPAGVP